MDVITSQYLRDNWRRCREAAAYEDKVFVVTYYGDIPVAVLLSPQTWRRGLERVPHEGHAELGVRESRTALRRVFTAARQGTHTLITLHGEENTVIVPYRWTLEALPELIQDDGRDDGRRAAGGNADSAQELAVCTPARRPERDMGGLIGKSGPGTAGRVQHARREPHRLSPPWPRQLHCGAIRHHAGPTPGSGGGVGTGIGSRYVLSRPD